MKLLGQRLQNVVSFKDQSVRFDQNRITFVRGFNKDAGDPTGNGAGKSLLLSCPANVFFFSPPTSIKKKAKKEVLGKNSSITQEMIAPDGKTYSITQTASKYKILCEGEDLGIRTTPLAEAFIREKLFPLSEVEYYTTAFISTQRPFLMQQSSDSDRLSYLSTIFRLEDYDLIRRYFLDRLGEIRESEVQLSLLTRDQVSFRSKLKAAKKSVANKSQIKTMKSEKESLDNVISALVDQEHQARVLRKDLNTLLTVERELDDLRKKYTSKEAPAKRIKFLKTQRSLVRAADSYHKLLASYKKSVSETQAKLDALKLPKRDKAALKALLTKAEKKADAIREELQEYKGRKREFQKLQDRVDSQRADLKEFGYTSKKPPDLKADYTEEMASVRTTLGLRSLLEHEHGDDEGKCPTCMSDVDFESIRKMVAKAKKRMPELKREVEAQECYRKLLESEKALSKVEYDEAREAELSEKKVAADDFISGINADLKVWDRHASLQSMLDDIEKPEKPEEMPEVDMTVDQLDAEIDLCEDVNKHLQARTKLLENNAELEGLRTVKQVKSAIAESDTKIEGLSKALKKRRGELAEIVVKLDGANSVAHEIEVYTKQYEKVTARIDKIKPLIEDKELFSTLAKAYSTKGLKTIVANDICGLLEQNLNSYSNLVFNEPFVFTVKAHDTGMSILVDRGNGHAASDVRTLSGAESNAFRMLFVMSLLPLLPADRRLNMLTLDEPCSHMDEISRAKFLQVFLPALAEVVPNIFVITPNADDYCEGSSQWLVTKQRGVSSVSFDVEPGGETDLQEVVKVAKKRAAKTKAAAKTKGKKK